MHGGRKRWCARFLLALPPLTAPPRTGTRAVAVPVSMSVYAFILYPFCLRLFAGSIPKELGGLRQLTVLWLGNNKLDGTSCVYYIPVDFHRRRYCPIGPDVYDLGQSHCPILSVLLFAFETGFIPGELGNLVKLKTLRLGSNRLAGESWDW